MACPSQVVSASASEEAMVRKRDVSQEWDPIGYREDLPVGFEGQPVLLQ